METFQDNIEPLPGWRLLINEVSNGCYKVSLTDRHGRQVELSCFAQEIDEKAQECIEWARQIDNGDLLKKKAADVN